MILNIHPRLNSYLKREIGFIPKVILDIGAHDGHWRDFAQWIWENARILAIEANKDLLECLKEKGDVEIALLGDADGTPCKFYKTNSGDTSGDSLFRERGISYNDNNCTVENRTMITLDSLLENNHTYKHPDLIKIDVQGSELNVLRGGVNTIKSAEFIVLEVQLLNYNEGAPKIFEIMKEMDILGYEMLDILEVHYLPHNKCICNSEYQSLNEMDILFIRKGSPYKKKIESNVFVNS